MRVFKVTDRENLTKTIIKAFELSDIVVIEKLIQWRELRSCVIEDERHNKVVLPILEYGVDQSGIRTFDKKSVMKSDGRNVKAKVNAWFLDEDKMNKEIKAVEKVSLKPLVHLV